MRSSALTLPAFTAQGLLPPGDYELTLEELRASFLVVGPEQDDDSSWDRSWRETLVNNLETLTQQLWRLGVSEVVLDGSFVEDKDHPNDIDGYFVCDAAQLEDLESQLNELDPHECWTWNRELRRPYRGYSKLQLPMWHHYRVELYPHYGQFSGICDRYGNELEFPSAFRLSRTYDPRGVVKILEGSMP